MTEAHAKGGREEELHTFRTGKGERRATHSGGCIFFIFESWAESVKLLEERER